MKTMSKLVILAQELFDSVSARIKEPLRTSIWEDLDCGEEGVAVMRTLDWALETNTSIDEKYWIELTSYFTDAPTQLSQSIRRRIEQVAHAA
jgi:hypothetical protein